MALNGIVCRVEYTEERKERPHGYARGYAGRIHATPGNAQSRHISHDGSPVFYEFTKAEEIMGVAAAISNHKIAVCNEEWQEKSSVDWSAYETRAVNINTLTPIIMTKICNDKTGSDKKLHVFCEFIIAAIIGSLVSFIHFPLRVDCGCHRLCRGFRFRHLERSQGRKEAGQPLLRLGSRLGFGRLPRRCSSGVPCQLLHMARYSR